MFRLRAKATAPHKLPVQVKISNYVKTQGKGNNPVQPTVNVKTFNICVYLGQRQKPHVNL